jgi:hypothetical protein
MDSQDMTAVITTDDLTPPAVIVLGDAAELTRGGEETSTESKQSPYD